jgi:hypothetical protein
MTAIICMVDCNLVYCVYVGFQIFSKLQGESDGQFYYVFHTSTNNSVAYLNKDI